MEKLPLAQSIRNSKYVRVNSSRWIDTLVHTFPWISVENWGVGRRSWDEDISSGSLVGSSSRRHPFYCSGRCEGTGLINEIITSVEILCNDFKRFESNEILLQNLLLRTLTHPTSHSGVRNHWSIYKSKPLICNRHLNLRRQSLLLTPTVWFLKNWLRKESGQFVHERSVLGVCTPPRRLTLAMLSN